MVVRFYHLYDYRPNWTPLGLITIAYKGDFVSCQNNSKYRDWAPLINEQNNGSTYVLSNISNTSDSVSSGYPNTEKRVENTTRSGVFLTKFEVFG